MQRKMFAWAVVALALCACHLSENAEKSYDADAQAVAERHEQEILRMLGSEQCRRLLMSAKYPQKVVAGKSEYFVSAGFKYIGPRELRVTIDATSPDGRGGSVGWTSQCGD